MDSSTTTSSVLTSKWVWVIAGVAAAVLIAVITTIALVLRLRRRMKIDEERRAIDEVKQIMATTANAFVVDNVSVDGEKKDTEEDSDSDSDASSSVYTSSTDDDEPMPEPMVVVVPPSTNPPEYQLNAAMNTNKFNNNRSTDTKDRDAFIAARRAAAIDQKQQQHRQKQEPPPPTKRNAEEFIAAQRMATAATELRYNNESTTYENKKSAAEKKTGREFARAQRPATGFVDTQRRYELEEASRGRRVVVAPSPNHALTTTTDVGRMAVMHRERGQSQTRQASHQQQQRQHGGGAWPPPRFQSVEWRQQ